MPRRYYRRSVRVVAPKKKWASNIIQGDLTGTSTYKQLVENAGQAASPTPVIVKCGNFKIRGDGTSTTTGAINLFIMYLPESWGTTDVSLQSAVGSHPEWVMGWTTLNVNRSSSNSEITPFSISTRLKRNLNSGDKVILYAQPVGTTSFNLAFTAQFFTCAN